MAFPASLPLPLSAELGGLGGRAPRAVYSMEPSSEPVTFWWENRGEEEYVLLSLCKGTLSQACKRWGVENRLGQSSAGESSALWEQSGLFGTAAGGYVHPLSLSACHGEDGCDESIADFLMTSVVSSRCAKIISCDGDLQNRFFISAVFDSCSKIIIIPTCVCLLLSLCYQRLYSVFTWELGSQFDILYIYQH